MPNREVRSRASQFRGLTNVRDPRRLGIQWLTTARNIDVDDDGYITRRPGYTKVADGSFRACYATGDETAMYLASGTRLYRMSKSHAVVELRDDLDPSAPVRFLEVNRQIYILNGARHWVAQGDSVRDWGLPVPPQPSAEPRDGSAPPGAYAFAVSYVASDGRESGLSPRLEVAAGTETTWRLHIPQAEGLRTAVYMTPAGDSTLYRLRTTSRSLIDTDARGIDLSTPASTEFRYPPPPGTVLGFFGGRVLIGEYFHEQRMSVVWQSDPLGYEHFQLDHAYLPVPGEVRMLLASSIGLIIGTDMEVYAWDGERLTKVFDYGVPPGTAGGEDDQGGVFFWSSRGLCVDDGGSLTNVMEETYSPPAAQAADVAIVHQGGYRKVVVLARETGEPYNAWRKD